MADIAASDVTVTILDQKIVNKQRHYRCSIAFGNGTLTYPAAGVPLPAASKFGMVDHLDYLNIVDMNDASGYVIKYDHDNKKLRLWEGDNNNANDAPLIELIGGSATPAAQTIYAIAVGW